MWRIVAGIGSIVTLWVVGALCSSARAQELVLVDDGVSRAPIVVFEDAPPYTRRAADELAEYIEKISGARPKIIEGEPDPVPEHAIWVGFQPTLRSLFPKIDFEFDHPEEILIAANEDHLVIAGRDRWDEDHLVVEGIDEKIVGKQREYGTVNAVYTFLRNHMDVRWLWPGDLGEDVIERKTIALSPFKDRYHPQIRGRGGIFAFSRLGNQGYGRSYTWTRRQRLQLDSLPLAGGHAFDDWWDRFHESHPEYFALQPNGSRSGFPKPGYAKLCQSNPAVAKQWLSDVEEKIEKDPTRTVFNASPNDSWLSGHCMCEDCRAWDHPDGAPRRYHWEDTNRKYVALSDRHVTFANRCARLLEQRYPDKDYHVLMSAYGNSRPVPVDAVPAENVIISSVANFFGRTHLKDRGSLRGMTYRQQFENWSAVAPHIAWRPNTGSPAGWQQGLPDLSVRQTIENLKFVADHGCIGIYIDHVWEHWATQGPQYYAMAQLAWDPSKDGEAILDDYYRRGFGPAADDVRAYFELMEEARMAYVEEHGYKSGVRNLTRLYTDELLSRAEKRLRRATEEAEDGRKIHRERVKFVRAGLRYTKRMTENIALMKQYWKDDNEKIARKVRENWKGIRRISENHPYAINWGPLRPRTPRMRGLHPDHPNPGWNEK